MRKLKAIATLAGACLAIAAVSPTGAQAATAAPAWKATVVPAPTHFFENTGEHVAECHEIEPEHEHVFYCDSYAVLVQNVGAVASEGPLTVSISLPPGVSILAEHVEGETHAGLAEAGHPPGGNVACERVSAQEASCTFEEPVQAFGFVMMRLDVHVEAGAASPVRSVVKLAGGAPGTPAPVETLTPVGPPPGKAEVERFSMEASGPAGEPDLQAGAHPTLLNTTLMLPTEMPKFKPVTPIENVNDLSFYLPLGMLGNAQVAPRCAASQLIGEEGLSNCSPKSRVGSIVFNGLAGALFLEQSDPLGAHAIYNLEPEPGTPAEFGFVDSIAGVVMYTAVVRHNGQYVLRVEVPGVARLAGLYFALTSFFGDLRENWEVEPYSYERDVGAFLTNPTDCGAGPLNAELEFNTFESPGVTNTATSTVYPRVTGCDELSFAPSIAVAPETGQADQPSGYAVDLRVPQAQNFGGDLGTPAVRGVSLTLPAGVSLSPAAAQGLASCAETGPGGINIEGPESEAPGLGGMIYPAPGKCPAASEIADVEAQTPLLGEHLHGHLFVATPQCGGAGQPGCGPADAEDGRLFGVYLEVAAPASGVIVKLAGHAHVNSATGQITVVFEDAPRFPLSEVSVVTTGGPRAVLATPQGCGSGQASASIVAWAGGGPGEAPLQATPTASTTTGGCSSVFAPSLVGGVADDVGGDSSTFTLALQRRDGEPDPSRLTVSLPPGLLASVAGSGRCEEPGAARGECPAGSQIGTATVAVGSGSSPLELSGPVYLSGPYEGAPFGLVIAIDAAAGPFNLGTVLVRATVSVDPHDAHVTVSTDPLPQIVDGVPVRLKSAAVTVSRPGFIRNPTECANQSITASVLATNGQSASASVPFTAAHCDTLGFAPKVTVSTSGRTSRLDGASLTFKLSQQPGEANVKQVDVQLPGVLPSRLATLRKACLAQQFEADPAGCPSESIVGSATAHTPLLAAALTGPAYLVSHGGAAFPDLVLLLQGEGVQIELVGRTQIKNGVTSSHFETVPDAPVSAITVSLPEGSHSVLAANANLCTRARTVQRTVTGAHGRRTRRTVHIIVHQPAQLKMPAILEAQNGKRIEEQLPIDVQGCSTTNTKHKLKHNPKPKRKPRHKS